MEINTEEQERGGPPGNMGVAGAWRSLVFSTRQRVIFPWLQYLDLEKVEKFYLAWPTRRHWKWNWDCMKICQNIKGLSFTFYKWAKLSSKVVALFYILTSSAQGFHFFSIFTNGEYSESWISVILIEILRVCALASFLVPIYFSSLLCIN